MKKIVLILILVLGLSFIAKSQTTEYRRVLIVSTTTEEVDHYLSANSFVFLLDSNTTYRITGYFDDTVTMAEVFSDGSHVAVAKTPLVFVLESGSEIYFLAPANFDSVVTMDTALFVKRILTVGDDSDNRTGIIHLINEDGDEWNISINGSDQGLFSDAGGGYVFDNKIVALDSISGRDHLLIKGTTDLLGSLDVGGVAIFTDSVSARAQLLVKGTADLLGSLDVGGVAIFTDSISGRVNLLIKGTTDLLSSLDVGGVAIFTDSLSARSHALVKGNLTVNGNVVLGSSITDVTTINSTITSDQEYAAGTTPFYFRTSLTATSGEHNNFRARAQSTALSASTSDIRGVYGQGITNVSLYGGAVTGVFANFIAKNLSTTVTGRALFAEAETEATPTALANLYTAYFRTKAHIAPSGDYYMMMMDGEKMATGFAMDAFIGMKSTTWGAAETSATYGIDMNAVTQFGTADIRLSNGGTIDNIDENIINITKDTVKVTGNFWSTGLVRANDSLSARAELLVKGTADLLGSLDVGGVAIFTDSLSARAQLLVKGTADLLGSLDVGGVAIFTDSISARAQLLVKGTSDLLGSLDVGGVAIFTDSLSARANALIKGSLTVDGVIQGNDSISARAELLVKGTTDLLSSLDVGGIAIFTDSLSARAQLLVKGTADLLGSLDVGGVAIFTDSLSARDHLLVKLTSTMIGELDLQNTMTIGNDAADVDGKTNYISANGDAGFVAITTSDQLILDGFSSVQIGLDGTDGILVFYAEQTTDQTVTLQANTAMTDDMVIYLPVDEPGSTLPMIMTSGGEIEFNDQAVMIDDDVQFGIITLEGGTTLNNTADANKLTITEDTLQFVGDVVELFLDSALVQIPDNYDQGTSTTVRSFEFAVHDTCQHDNSDWHTLYLDATSALMTIPASAIWTGRITVSGMETVLGQYFSYTFEFSITRDAANNTVLRDATAGIAIESDATYACQIIADDINESILVQVMDSDGAGELISWNAKVEVTEVVYYALP